MTLPAAAVRAPAAVDRYLLYPRQAVASGRWDRHQTEGHPTVTQTLHRILCGQRQQLQLDLIIHVVENITNFIN